MSTMMRSTRKPPLALRSPIRLRPRRPVQSSLNNPQTPSDKRAPSYAVTPLWTTKSGLTKQSSNLEEPYQTMSCELKALTKMVQHNLYGSTTSTQSANAYDSGPLFQRGRFYDEYSARRNERLKRKRGGEPAVEKKTPCKQFLGVRMESAKRTGDVKKFESAVATTQRQRYSLRSSCKENKKPPQPLAMVFEKTVEKKTAVRRSARKGY